ncbi:c-type cytochrome biogenesis protein CcsB [Rhodococcus aerolatus]
MPGPVEVAALSDLSYRSAVGIYVLATVLLAAELAGTTVRATAARDAARQLVGAGAPAGPPAGVPGRVAPTPRRAVADRLGRGGVALTVLALGLHVASLVLRGVAAGRAPWGNMYEFTSLATAATVLGMLLFLRSHRTRPVLLFVLLPVVVLLFVGGTVLYSVSAPVVPALQSYWLVIHVSVIATASGVMLFSGVASALFILRLRHPDGEERPSPVGQLARRLPSAAVLDRVAYRATVFSFPFFTIGVILGAVWAEAAWGRFWGWDPKEVAAFVTWVVFAAYLHARATAGWRTGRAAWVNVLGAATVVFNLFFINLVVSGLHSYAGLT